MKTTLLSYMERMQKMPHEVRKQQDGRWLSREEAFRQMSAEMMSRDGLPVGMTCAPEEEVLGVDTPDSLEAAQKLFARLRG